MSKNFEELSASFFSSCEGCSLGSAEKTGGWNELRAKLDDVSAAHAFQAEAADVRQFFEPCGECLLSPVEKEALRMELRSSRATSSTVQFSDHGSPFSFTRLFSFSWGMPALALFLLVVGSGISYVSAEALPGEFLYSVKHIKEQIRSNLQWSTESRAEGETERVRVRVHEAEKIRARKEKNVSVSADAEGTLHQEFLIERRNANSLIRALDAEGKAQAAAHLRARLNAYKDRYEKLSGKTIEPLEDEKEKEKKHSLPLIEATTGASASSAFSSSSPDTSSSSAQSSERSSAQASFSSAEASVRGKANDDAKAASVKADIEATVTLPVPDASALLQ